MGWTVLTVFVDGDNDEIHTRLLQRIVGDVLGYKDSYVGGFEQVIPVYARRITAMRTVEQAWRAEAYTPVPAGQEDPYNVKIARFNAENEAINVTVRASGAIPGHSAVGAAARTKVARRAARHWQEELQAKVDRQEGKHNEPSMREE